MGVNERRVDIDYEVGELVEVIEGPFAGFQGKIEEIDLEKDKIKVSVDMFGRETNMELDYEQIEKVL